MLNKDQFRYVSISFKRGKITTNRFMDIIVNAKLSLYSLRLGITAWLSDILAFNQELQSSDHRLLKFDNLV